MFPPCSTVPDEKTAVTYTWRDVPDPRDPTCPGVPRWDALRGVAGRSPLVPPARPRRRPHGALGRLADPEPGDGPPQLVAARLHRGAASDYPGRGVRSDGGSGQASNRCSSGGPLRGRPAAPRDWPGQPLGADHRPGVALRRQDVSWTCASTCTAIVGVSGSFASTWARRRLPPVTRPWCWVVGLESRLRAEKTG
jgi:hypothetical protein